MGDKIDKCEEFHEQREEFPDEELDEEPFDPKEIPKWDSEEDSFNPHEEIPDEDSEEDSFNPHEEIPNEDSEEDSFNPHEEIPDEDLDEDSFNPHEEIPDEEITDEDSDEESFNPHEEIPNEDSEEITNPSRTDTVTVVVPEEKKREAEQDSKNKSNQEAENEWEIVTPEDEPEKSGESTEVMEIRVDLEEWGYPHELPPNYKPRNEITRPALPLNYKPKNKIERLNLSPNYRPTNKILRPDNTHETALQNEKETKKMTETIPNITSNQENKFHLPKERISVKSEDLKKVYNEIIKKNSHISSNLRIGEELGIGSNIYKTLKGNLGFSHQAFDKLEELTKKEIPHTIKIGQESKIILEKNEKIAEFASIILGDGNITSSKGNYRLDISLNNVDEAKYVEYVKGMVKAIYNQDPQVKPIKDFKGAAGNEKGVNIQLNKAAVVESLIKIGLKPGNKTENAVSVPNWIKENFKKSSLKGLFDTDGCVSVEKGDKSIRLTFPNASKPLVKDFKEMCDSLGIKSSAVHGPYKNIDPRTGTESTEYSVSINSKEHVKKFIETVKPMKWDIKYEKIGQELMQLYPHTKNIKEVINEAFRYKRAFYSMDYAMNLKKLFIEHGGYKAAVDYLNSQNLKVVPPRESMSKFIKNLFNEKEIKEKYGETGYNKWHSYNSNILIDPHENKFKKFPNIVKKALCNEIIVTPRNNHISILKNLKSKLENQDLNGNYNEGGIKILKYERLLYLWNNLDTKPIVEKYMRKLSEFTHTIVKSQNVDRIPSMSDIYKDFSILGEEKAIKELITNIKKEK